MLELHRTNRLASGRIAAMAHMTPVETAENQFETAFLV